MSVKVTPVKAGWGYVYLVRQGDNAFLVDSGNKGFEDRILKVVKSKNITPGALKFLFVTHAHFDHAGSAAALVKKTGLPLIAHAQEVKYLERGGRNLPKGTSGFYKFLIAAGKVTGKMFSSFPPVKTTISFEDELDLKDFGVEGKIIHTPGHTSGSSSLIIDANAFVGDTLFNIWNGVIYPVFADNINLLHESWRKLLEEEVKYFYPAHGKRLTYKEFKKEAIKRGIIW